MYKSNAASFRKKGKCSQNSIVFFFKFLDTKLAQCANRKQTEYSNLNISMLTLFLLLQKLNYKIEKNRKKNVLNSNIYKANPTLWMKRLGQMCLIRTSGQMSSRNSLDCNEFLFINFNYKLLYLFSLISEMYNRPKMANYD